ncbi:MAG: efflux RND transporter permease subunit [Succinivibrionaceae bacterium]|nr:efflux RND transporter permease subunit [Succinivibrionaceae bacterium]
MPCRPHGQGWRRGPRRGPAQPSPIAVTTAPAEETTIEGRQHLAGTVEGLTTAIISGRYSDWVSAVYVENGTEVARGQTLLGTDQNELSNALLIDLAKMGIGSGLDPATALARAGQRRFRPIMMTTIAMAFAMLPVAVGIGDGGEARAPMAHAIRGGLITSTALTLVVIPCLYAMIAGRHRGAMGSARPACTASTRPRKTCRRPSSGGSCGSLTRPGRSPAGATATSWPR